mgnify:FL=1
MNKKRWVLGLGGNLIGLLMIGLVKAQEVLFTQSPNYYMVTFIDWGNSNYGPLFAALFGVSELDEFLFARILVFLLIFSVVHMSLTKSSVFGSNKIIYFVITSIVSILSVRYMGDNEFINGILLPYGVLGAAIVVFLPLLIYFLFVHNSVPGQFGRKAAWTIYGIIFIVMWGFRTADDIGLDVDIIYLLGMGFVLLNFIFDSPIHEYFGSKSFKSALRLRHSEKKGEIAERLQELEDRAHLYSTHEYDRLKKALVKSYKHHARKS